MAALNNLRCFDGYIVQAIDPAIKHAFEYAASMRGREAQPILLRLDCYLQVTRQRLTAQATRHQLSDIAQGFVGALHSPAFEAGHRPRTAYSHAYVFEQLCGIVFGSEGTPRLPLTTSGIPSAELSPWVERFEQTDLDLERVRFWNGWTATNKNGRKCHYRFYAVHQRLGTAFTSALFEAASSYMAGRMMACIPCLNDFAQYIGSDDESDISPEHFEDPCFVSDFMARFFRHYFMMRHAGGVRMSHARLAWSAFIRFLETCVLGRIWAEPFVSLPRPVAKVLPGASTHVRNHPDGRAYKVKLLTPVPLHLSDQDAKETVFREIRRDVHRIRMWAEHEIRALWARHERRLVLAPQGVVSKTGRIGITTGLGWRTSRQNPEWLAHAAATFEANGPMPVAGMPAAAFYALYPRPLAKTAWELGLPHPGLLSAYAALLIIEHPAITPAFLQTLEVFDETGNRTGLMRRDGRMFLTSYKRRRGPTLAEQVFELNDDLAEIMEQLVAVTTPAREYLRQQGDPSWRKLFLTMSQLGAYPRPWRAVILEVHRSWLTQRLQQLLSLPVHDANELADRFALGRLRASVGALVYLETGSVQAMAKALGHVEWKPSLLDHYLPRPLHEFFVERWVRIFQTGIIVEALRDSPHLLTASAFSSMEELHLFLHQHAHQFNHREEERTSPQATAKGSAMALFGLSVDLLAMMLSLQQAVDSSTRPVLKQAEYWAQVTHHLCAHIRSQVQRPDLIAMLVEAGKVANAEEMVELIHG